MIRILSTTINARLLTAIISMDQIISLSSGCVLNAIKITKLMTGLMRKLQSARITNVNIKAQRFKASLKDTKLLDYVTA
jgi:hypothetical protein